MHEKSTSFIIVTLFALVVVCAVAMYFSLTILPLPQPARPLSAPMAVPSPVQSTIQPLLHEIQPLADIPRLALYPVQISNIIDTGYLALINHQYSISAEPTGYLTPAWPNVPVSFIEGMYLHTTALQAVADMLNSARNADMGSFFVSSGFRGVELQAELYANDANRGFAMPPGHSEHHTGLAADIFPVGVSGARMAASAPGRWLAENSYRYGLILRYPKGATHITGIEFEPWHFRYVGRPHAYYMQRYGLVLEEYIELIRYTGGFSIRLDGRTYHVFHAMPNDGVLYLPSLAFTVSSDNTGGFIVTAKC